MEPASGGPATGPEHGTLLPLHGSGAMRAARPGARPWEDAALERIRHGVYADADAHREADRRTRFLARIRAVAATRAEPTFARESALAVHGLPYGAEPSDVHTIGGSTTARRKAGVSHATGALDPADVEVVDGVRVCSIAHALADVARRREAVVSVAAIDAALRAALVSRDAVLDALERQSRRGRSRAAWAIGFADGRAESVGESWSRVRIHELGFPPPELQPWVVGASGARHRPDMRWELPQLRRPLLGEFDGAVKYGALAALHGRTGAAALAAEKRREDDLRVESDVARWVWADLLAPARLELVLRSHGLPRVLGGRFR